jgi:hypothetical protein
MSPLAVVHFNLGYLVLDLLQRVQLSGSVQMACWRGTGTDVVLTWFGSFTSPSIHGQAELRGSFYSQLNEHGCGLQGSLLDQYQVVDTIIAVGDLPLW